MARRFIAIIDVGEDWDGNKSDMATWLDAAMQGGDVESIVYDSIADLVADNVLDALAETG